jgi:Putative peptidoglycan binding domain
MGSAAIAAQGHDQTRAKSHARATKPTAMTTTTRVGGSAGAVQTRQRFATGRNSATVGTRNRVVTRSSYPYRTYGYRSYSYGYPYYSYGYPYYGYGYYPSSGFSFGYYPYDYGYDSSYGYYYSRPAYGTYASGSVVAQVQARLARAGYYHGAIDGAMGPRTRYAIERYERDHGLRIDGAISGSLLRSMGLRY